MSTDARRNNWSRHFWKKIRFWTVQKNIWKLEDCLFDPSHFKRKENIDFQRWFENNELSFDTPKEKINLLVWLKSVSKKSNNYHSMHVLAILLPQVSEAQKKSFLLLSCLLKVRSCQSKCWWKKLAHKCATIAFGNRE